MGVAGTTCNSGREGVETEEYIGWGIESGAGREVPLGGGPRDSERTRRRSTEC